MTAPLSAQTTGCDSANMCTYTFILHGVWDDSWVGSSFSVLQNDSIVADVTLAEGLYTDTVTMMLCNNVSTSLVWNPGGYYDEECSFEMYDHEGVIIYATSGTPSGTLTTFTTNCLQPCPRPSDITVTNITTNSAEIGWTVAGTETAWNLEYKISTDATWTIVPVITNPYTLTNLTNLTNYDVRVQAICSGSEVSEYRETSFATAGCNAADQCTFTFTLTDSYNDGWSGGYLSVLQNDVVVAILELTDGSSATETVQLCSDYFTSIVWTAGQYANEAGFSVVGPNVSFTHNGMNTYTTYTFTSNCLIEPTVATEPASNIEQTTATLNGTITNPDNVTIAARGFEWKPVSAANYTVLNATGTSMSATLNNLTSNTSYTYRAFVTTAHGTYYGDDMTFTTLQAEPTVATAAATNIGQTTVMLNGTITNPDNVTITAKGFEWKASAGGTYTPVNVTSTNLTYILTGLTANTDYTYKAFITFNGTTVYGNEMNFTTLEEVVEPCATPTNLHQLIATKDEGSINVAWTDNAGVSQWNLQYRLQNSNEDWTTVTVNNEPDYSITGLVNDEVYEIRVQAVCDPDNLSEWSNILTATAQGVGINDHLLNNIALYPNPANDVVNVQCTMYDVQEVEVIDVYGKVINTVNVTDNPTCINVSGLAAGMYFVRVTTEQGVATKTFVKK